MAAIEDRLVDKMLRKQYHLGYVFSSWVNLIYNKNTDYRQFLASAYVLCLSLLYWLYILESILRKV